MLPLALVALIAPLAPAPPPAPAEPPRTRLIGSVAIAADATDLSGLSSTLPGGIPHNRLASMGSGLARVANTDRYIMVADRGPADGAEPYRCRFHEFEITIDAAPGASEPVALRLVSTTLLTDTDGTPLIGSAAAIEGTPAGASGRRFDPEAVRLLPGGDRLLIADEYAPSLSIFERATGKRLSTLDVPAAWRVQQPMADPVAESAANTPPAGPGGRVPNNGFEGLDLSPDGGHAWALLQGPLLQDGGKAGRVCRVLRAPLGPGASAAQFGVPLARPGLNFNEILCIDGERFLAIERDGRDGGAAEFKRISLIDLRRCTDTGRFATFPRGDVPSGVRIARNRTLIDLLDPAFMLAGPGFPAKVEGLCWGRTLATGERVLLITTDNDFRSDQPSWVWAFAVPEALLAAE